MTFPLDGYQLSDDAGDSWWFLDTRMTVKVSGEESGGAYTLIEFSANPGFGSPRHIHQDEDEAFYVLDGEMRLVCGPKEWHASTGSLAFMPRGIEHAVLVTGETPVRALQITNPAGFEDFLGELGRRPDTPGLPTPQTHDFARMAEVSRRYGKIVVGPPMTS